MLISESRRIPLDCFRHPEVTPAYWADAEATDAANAGVTAPIGIIGTFAIPGGGGRPSSPSVEAIRFCRDAVEFPEEGEFYFYCHLGAFKCLILDTALPPLQKAMRIFAFIAKNVVHSAADAWLCCPEGFAGNFHWERLISKFFYSDQPLQLYCGDVARFLATLWLANGLHCRVVALGGSGHIVAEVWDPESADWAMFDADWGLYCTDETGKPLSSADMADRVKQAPCDSIESEVDDGKLPFQVADIVEKRWLRWEFNRSFRCTAQISWNPSLLNPDVNLVERYRSVIKQCLSTEIRYEPITLDAAGRHLLRGPAVGTG